MEIKCLIQICHYTFLALAGNSLIPNFNLLKRLILKLKYYLFYSSAPLIAQLMRIHVVTPKAPVHVTLNPMVQPDENGGPIFVTGFDTPIELTQSTYWVLRLPYPLDF